jgi:hypothetical protein
MRSRPAGLVPVPDTDLRRLVALLHRGQLTAPLRRSDLLGAGLNRLADHGDLLLGLDQRAVLAVIRAVLEERAVTRSPVA